jgi:hypothetical protein
VVITLGLLGGALIGLTNGVQIPKILCFKGREIKPFFGSFNVPAITGMIIFGCIARNFVGDFM